MAPPQTTPIGICLTMATVPSMNWTRKRWSTQGSSSNLYSPVVGSGRGTKGGDHDVSYVGRMTPEVKWKTCCFQFLSMLPGVIKVCTTFCRSSSSPSSSPSSLSVNREQRRCIIQANNPNSVSSVSSNKSELYNSGDPLKARTITFWSWATCMQVAARRSLWPDYLHTNNSQTFAHYLQRNNSWTLAAARLLAKK